MFSLYHQILVRPLPVPEPERLVNFAAPGPGKFGGNVRRPRDRRPRSPVQLPMFRELEARQTGFTGLAAHTDFVSNLSYREQPSYSRGGTMVSGRYFDVLNLRPALGRLITPEDEPQVGESAVVVLGYDYWQRRFRRRPERDRRAADGQRHGSRDHRRGARGLHGHDPRRARGRVRAVVDALAHGADARGIQRRPTRFGFSTTGRMSSAGSSPALRSSRRMRSSIPSTAAF